VRHYSGLCCSHDAFSRLNLPQLHNPRAFCHGRPTSPHSRFGSPSVWRIFIPNLNRISKLNHSDEKPLSRLSDPILFLQSYSHPSFNSFQHNSSHHGLIHRRSASRICYVRIACFQSCSTLCDSSQITQSLRRLDSHQQQCQPLSSHQKGHHHHVRHSPGHITTHHCHPLYPHTHHPPHPQRRQ
jgi:hypothetical protein